MSINIYIFLHHASWEWGGCRAWDNYKQNSQVVHHGSKYTTKPFMMKERRVQIYLFILIVFIWRLQWGQGKLIIKKTIRKNWKVNPTNILKPEPERSILINRNPWIKRMISDCIWNVYSLWCNPWLHHVPQNGLHVNEILKKQHCLRWDECNQQN